MAIIQRFLSETNLGRMQTDCRFLTEAVGKSEGELYLALREGYFNVYHRGCSVAKVTFRPLGVFEVAIHGQYLANGALEKLRTVAKPVAEKKYATWRVKGKNLHRLLKADHIRTICSNIKKSNSDEELAFEQMFLVDNLDREDFIIIDRQVADRGTKGRLDLLALVAGGAGGYRFCAIEVKLGNNPELGGPVFEQLAGYVQHIDESFHDYKRCYEESYRQQKLIGLVAASCESIDIQPGVQGLIVVLAHAGVGKGHIAKLQQQYPDVKVAQFTHRLNLTALGW